MEKLSPFQKQFKNQFKNQFYFSICWKKKRRLKYENIVYFLDQAFVVYFYKIADKIWFFILIQNM